MRRKAGLASLLLVAATPGLLAWGHIPHAEIVKAALTVIPAEDQIAGRLGEETPRLCTWVLLGDWRDSFVSLRTDWKATNEELAAQAVEIYSNDYLIFPVAPKHYQHGVPEVVETYRPFFQRSLQALRTETAPNAARWIGSLLHFVTDSGSPPHAAGLSGEVHFKMENWLDASQIDVRGYKPRLLGNTDEEAVAGLESRMKGLLAFSKQRAGHLLPLVENNERPACEPIALESAAETARVVADLLHTLLFLSREASGRETVELHAGITAPTLAGMEMMPAKLLLLDTNYSTLSEPVALRQGTYVGSLSLRNLQPGNYRAFIYRPGCKPIFTGPLALKKGAPLWLHRSLEPDAVPGNLVRNADFRIHWSAKGRPENWRFDRSRNRWVSDNIKIDAGRTYRVLFKPKGRAPAKLSLQWMAQHWQPLGDPVEVETRQEASLTAPDQARYVEILIVGPAPPEDLLSWIALTKEAGLAH